MISPRRTVPIQVRGFEAWLMRQSSHPPRRPSTRRGTPRRDALSRQGKPVPVLFRGLRQHVGPLVRPTGITPLRTSESAGGMDVLEPDEERLVSQLRARRRGAGAELIRLHYRGVYRLLVHLSRDVHQAEDLAQETF